MLLSYIDTYWAALLFAVEQALGVPLALAMIVFSIYAICKTRQHIRMSSRIQEISCQGREDCCCATFCPFCTVMQMARHTAEYKVYPGQCCSETGLLPYDTKQLQFGETEIV